MKVKDILRVKERALITIDGGASLLDASRLLREHNIGVLLVMDHQRAPAGIISERDIVREFAKTGGDCETLRVREVMSQDLITSQPDDDLRHVMNLMTDYRIRHLPVLDGGELVGLVSIGDVVKALISASETEIEHLRSYITGTPS